MNVNTANSFSDVTVPIFEFNEMGCLKPNPLFHRPIDKLHSRCIEYPFAASKVGDAKTILDVGTVKSDPIWISWLESLPMEVHATDYDVPYKPLKRIRFHRSDVRDLPLSDNYFDTVIAVSVIEHIGLELPQVIEKRIPEISAEGDLDAVRELARVLKPGGELIMTVPFGVYDGLILGNQARNYTKDSIRKFESILSLDSMDYYEYQSAESPAGPSGNTLQTKVKCGILNKVMTSLNAALHMGTQQEYIEQNDIPGEVTWRKVPLELTRATHNSHLEGVVCCVWKKMI